MTREEAIHELSEMKLDAWTDHREMEALDMAINILRSIEDIKAEIDKHCSDNRDRNDGLYIAMKIIDKHIGGDNE